MPWYTAGSAAGGTTNARLNITGSVADSSGLPVTSTPGTAYITRDTGHLWVYDGTMFVDAGNVSGPPGPAPTLTAGPTTALAAGTNPTANVVKLSAGSYRLDLGLPTTPAAQKQSFTYAQSAAAGTWTFTHDLDFVPAGLRIFDQDNPSVAWNVNVDYDGSSKTFTLHFPVAVRGTVVVS